MYCRYRVRPKGDTDPDHEFEIDATSPHLAASAFAQAIGDEEGHRAFLVEVWMNGDWKKYRAAPYTVTNYATEEVV